MADPHPTILLANGVYRSPFGKTAHGLVRASRRYRIVAVVDPSAAGEDAGRLLDGRPRSIPILESVRRALEVASPSPTHCVVGVANFGGHLPAEVRADLVDALHGRLHLVNGLHQCLGDDAELRDLASRNGVDILDLRRPKPVSELHHWTGEIAQVRTPRVAVLGTDSAIGKRTTATLLHDALTRAGLRVELIYTGQTGYLQGVARYGFLLDATVNDFVAGELEHAIVTCDRERSPDLILIEGQSGLCAPQGPGGPVLIRAGQAAWAVLQHKPARTFYLGLEGERYRIGPLSEHLALLKAYGARPIAVTLNDEGLSGSELAEYQRATAAELGIPVLAALRGGIEQLRDAVLAATGAKSRRK